MNGMTPDGIMLGLLAALVFALVVVKAQKIIDRKKQENKKHEDSSYLDLYASNEAMYAVDTIKSEFSRLVFEIAWQQVKIDGKLLTHKEADSDNCPEGKLISSEDMEAAFLEAAKLVLTKCNSAAYPCKTNCDKQSLLQKIQKLRKKYEA